MADIKFTELPSAPSADVADIICAVQSGANVQMTQQQVLNLFRDNIVLNYAGDPNGNVEGAVYEFLYDTANKNLYICTSTGTAATAVWTLIGSNLDGELTNLTVSNHTICGDAGTEGSGININGVTYDSVLKVSNINSSKLAQIIYHRHSTTTQPILLASRSNSDTDAHVAVTNGMSLFTLYASGWTASHYDLFAAIDLSADTTGTISATSAPGRIRFQVSANGAQTPTTAVTITNDKKTTFAGVITPSAGITGVTDGSSATAGNVGEVISSGIAVGSAVSLTTATPANVTSITLTAGDWDVHGLVVFNTAPTTTVASVDSAISLTSATLPTSAENINESRMSMEASFTTGGDPRFPTGTARINVATTTTVYLVAQMIFGTSTSAAYGNIWARRVR